MAETMTTADAWVLCRSIYREDGERARKLREACRAAERSALYILLHDGDGYDPAGTSERGNRMNTAAALPGIIADARDAGYEFRSLGDLLR